MQSLLHGLYRRRGVAVLIGVAAVATIAVAQQGSHPAAPDARWRRSASPVEIRLLPGVTTGRTRLRIGDVAALTGGTPGRRERIAQLEIANVGNATNYIVRSKQIRIRCLLSAIQPEEFRISGAPETAVRTERRNTLRDQTAESDIESLTCEAIRRELAEVWRTAPDNITVRLVRPLRMPRSVPVDTTDATVRAYLPEKPEPGLLTAITVHDIAGHKSIEIPASVSVSHSRSMEPGVARVADERVGHIRPVSGSRQPDSQTTHRRTGRPDVRPRDLIQLIARHASGVSVRLSGAEVRQTGYVGDYIRVRNPSSGKDIIARLVSPTFAVIDIRRD